MTDFSAPRRPARTATTSARSSGGKVCDASRSVPRTSSAGSVLRIPAQDEGELTHQLVLVLGRGLVDVERYPEDVNVDQVRLSAHRNLVGRGHDFEPDDLAAIAQLTSPRRRHCLYQQEAASRS